MCLWAHATGISTKRKVLAIDDIPFDSYAKALQIFSTTYKKKHAEKNFSSNLHARSTHNNHVGGTDITLKKLFEP